MPENRQFLRSTNISTKTSILVDGVPAVLTYRELIDQVEALVGRAATLFAEPVLPRNSQTLGAALSWYCSYDGPVLEIADMDETARRPVVEKLTERLTALAPALRDPVIGAKISAWLNVASGSSFLSVGGEPVLVDWGFVPPAALESTAAAQAHFAATFGKYAPLLNLRVPRLVESTIENSPGPAPAAVGPQPISGVVGVASTRPPDRRRPWMTPLVASLLAGAVLLILLIPGVLIYGGSNGQSQQSALEARVLRESNESLEAQIRALDAAAADKTCRIPDRFVPVPGALPSPDSPGQGGLMPAGSPPGGPQQDGQTGPSKPAPDQKMELLPRPADKVNLPPGPNPPGSPPGTPPAKVQSLADVLDGSTVLVFSIIDTKGAASQGSGFFISAKQIVTNRHVIEGANPDLIFVTNQKLGTIRRARIVAKSDQKPTETDIVVDLAVLEIEQPSEHPFLKVGVTPAKLSTAYVAGFPGFITQRDNDFKAFIDKLRNSLGSADVEAALKTPGLTAPSADLRTGRVNNVISVGTHGVSVLVHDMQLAPGNSGGPLVDACGRLGGVNTLLFPSKDGPQQANVAQDVSAIRTFLTGKGISFTGDDAPCEPVVASTPQPAPGPASSPTPNPRPAPSPTPTAVPPPTSSTPPPVR